MRKFIKTLITIAMVSTWVWTAFMGTFATHQRGRLLSIVIGVSINVVLALYYTYQTNRPQNLRE